MELTLKSKQTRNLSNTLNRADSLVYSDATLFNSNSALPYIPEIPPNLRSHRSLLQKQEDPPRHLEMIDRAVSRQMERSVSRMNNSEEDVSLS